MSKIDSCQSFKARINPWDNMAHKQASGLAKNLSTNFFRWPVCLYEKRFIVLSSLVFPQLLYIKYWEISKSENCSNYGIKQLFNFFSNVKIVTWQIFYKRFESSTCKLNSVAVMESKNKQTYEGMRILPFIDNACIFMFF